MGYDFLSDTYRGRCLRVIDGDTIDVQLDCGLHIVRYERLRLARINTPELHAPDAAVRAKAQAAADKTKSLLLATGEVAKDWPLKIVTSKDDAFGRWLAEVTIKLPDGSELNINDELLKGGFAVPYVRK